MTSPRLWSWSLSPFSAKVRIALAEKGIEVELIEIDPRNRPEQLRRLNPTATVPVLEVDGTGIRESNVICEWFEETHPDRPLLPADPTSRAKARGLLRWVDDELTVPFFLSMRKEAFGLEPTDHPEVISHLRQRLMRRYAAVEKLLAASPTPWLAGTAEPTLADLAAIPLAIRVAAWKPELQPSAEAHPGTTAWLQRLRERPSASEIDRRGEPVSAGG